MKSSIVGFLVGSSHERLNWLHRTVARCLLFTVTIHFGFFWREWSVWHVVESEIQMMPIVKYGMGAWFTLLWIVISSFAPIRNLRYEVFVIQHILSFTAFITLIMLHVPSYAKIYVWISIGFYIFDRTVRTLRLIYRNLSIFHRKSSSTLSCKAHLIALPALLPESPFKARHCDHGPLDNTSSYPSRRFPRYNPIHLRLPRHLYRDPSSWYLSSAPIPVLVVGYTSAQDPSFQRLLNQHKKSYSRSS